MTTTDHFASDPRTNRERRLVDVVMGWSLHPRVVSVVGVGVRPTSGLGDGAQRDLGVHPQASFS
ncbi:hypothetical protein [Nonomuraea sp. NPDC052265]|uniref:hypothetical protein n=1 Tax=Nonomuraea sp. NPDC052265 TaxID=3364374 RepID=UPI0037C85107